VRLRALINRSEELRSIVVRRDGRWDVERGSQGVAFHVCIPYHPEARTPRAEEQPQPFDLNSFMAAYGDSPEIMREILRLYRDEAPARLSSIDEGIEEGDYGRVAKAAHSLANTSGTLQSKQAVQAARALENAAREAKPDECRSHASRLVQIVNGIVRQINSALEEAS
jgi:HPt (histidine-containing phosphotransfer) domain-containing protein